MGSVVRANPGTVVDQRDAGGTVQGGTEDRLGGGAAGAQAGAAEPGMVGPDLADGGQQGPADPAPGCGRREHGGRVDIGA